MAKEYKLIEFTLKCGFTHKLSTYVDCGLECLFLSEYNLQRANNNVHSSEMRPIW